MKKKLINFKTISNENLIKLWIAHYKKYADNSESRLFGRGEMQEIYDEGYKRGLADTLMQLYNAIYGVHITARQDLNNGIMRLWTHVDIYGRRYQALEQIAKIYNRSDLLPKTKEETDYREKIALYLLRDRPLKQSDTDEYTVGEEIIGITVKRLKSSILFCKKLEEIAGRDIMSNGAKEQIKSARQVIRLLLTELSDNVGWLQYTLGLMKDEDGNPTKRNEAFYKLIDGQIGVDKLAKRMGKLEEIINRQTYSKELMWKLKDAEGKSPEEIRERYPIEDFGLSREEIDKVDSDVRRWGKLKRMV